MPFVAMEMKFARAMSTFHASGRCGPQVEKTKLHNYHTQFKLAALAFAVMMTLAVNGSLLLLFDAMAQGSMLQITLPTVTV